MNRTASRFLYATTAALLLPGLAIVVQYQVRPRLLVGESLVIGLSKGAWVECLSNPLMDGRIEGVNLHGVVVTDTNGKFTKANAFLHIQTGKRLCPTLGIMVLDATKRTYFVPFNSLGELKQGESWIWSNPFPSTLW